VVLRVKDGVLTPVAGTVGATGGQATDTSLEPTAAAAAPNGDVYVADRLGHRVVRISPAGTLTPVAGTGVPDNDGDPLQDAGRRVDGRPAREVRLYAPGLLRVGPGGELYLTSDGGDVLARVDAAGAYRFIWPATGHRVRDLLPVAGGKLLVTRQVYAGGYSLYQREELVLVDPVTLAETVLTTWTDGEEDQDEAVEALAVLPGGDVLAIGPRQVRRWRGGTALEPVVRLPQPIDFDYLRPAATADAAGRVYVTTPTHLHRLDLATGVLTRVAGPGAPLLGGTGVDDGLARPTSPTVAADGSLWLVDWDHKQVKRFPASALALRA